MRLDICTYTRSLTVRYFLETLSQASGGFWALCSGKDLRITENDACLAAPASNQA